MPEFVSLKIHLCPIRTAFLFTLHVNHCASCLCAAFIVKKVKVMVNGVLCF